MNLTLICLVAIFGLGYLVQTNDLATKGYEIRDLENKISKLQEEKSDLNLEALNLQSMGNINQKVNDLGMVLVNEAEYLMPTPVAVAR